MTINSLDELRKVDDRTLHYTPHGLGIGVQMTPEGSAEFQQRVVDQFELAPDVAEGTRASFERLRTIFPHGVLCYEIFTLVNDHALLVIEQALRDRFVDYHQGAVTFVDASQREHAVAASGYEDLFTYISKHKNHKLRVGAGPQTMTFKGMLADLRTWARKTGLLRGQRNRGIERALSNLRNFVAHPTSYHLLGPNDAAHTLSDLAEIINQLWGHQTPGGRLYPAPLERNVVVLAWDRAGSRIETTLASRMFERPDIIDDGREYAILRAMYSPQEYIADPELYFFDSRHEVTRFPVDFLWGPGSMAQAAAWYKEYRPGPDECDYLDRIFAIRQDGTQLYLPINPEVAATVTEAERVGTWHVIRADHPGDARAHVLNVLAATGCSPVSECHRCSAETLASGTYSDVAKFFTERPSTPPTRPLDLRSPWAPPPSCEIAM